MFGRTRRQVLKGLAGGMGLAASPGLAGRVLAANAKVIPTKPFRIFMVLGRGESDNEFGFKDYLARHQIPVEYTIRNTANDSSLIPKFVAEIKATRPDLVYTWGTPQTLGVVGPYDDPDPSKFVRDIPVVFTFVAEPQHSKIVPNMERPGGNVTGTVHIAPIVTQLNTLLAYREVNRIGVIYNPGESNSVANVDALRKACGDKNISLIEKPVPKDSKGEPNGATIPAMVGELAQAKAEFIYVGPDTFVAFFNREPLAQAALANKLPTFSCTELIVRKDRALMGLITSAFGLGQFTASKVMEILIDKKSPGDIPVETLHRFSVLINMQAAKELHFYPPISLINIAEAIL